jgi:hypothetical protein
LVTERVVFVERRMVLVAWTLVGAVRAVSTWLWVVANAVVKVVVAGVWVVTAWGQPEVGVI